MPPRAPPFMPPSTILLYTITRGHYAEYYAQFSTCKTYCCMLLPLPPLLRQLRAMFMPCAPGGYVFWEYLLIQLLSAATLRHTLSHVHALLRMGPLRCMLLLRHHYIRCRLRHYAYAIRCFEPRQHLCHESRMMPLYLLLRWPLLLASCCHVSLMPAPLDADTTQNKMRRRYLRHYVSLCRILFTP